MQRERNEGTDMRDAKRYGPGNVSSPQTLHRQAQLFVEQNNEDQRLKVSSEQDEANEQAKEEARRESNHRSAKNNRLLQKNLIATLHAENEHLRTELTTALNQIGELKLTLEEETQRALDYNRCLQLLVENNKMMKRQESRQELLHRIPCTNSTVSSGPTLSRLLEMARYIDDLSSASVPTSSVEPYQGYDPGSRLLGDAMMRGGEQTAASFASRRTSYLSETYPSADNATTSDRGVIYPSAFYSRNYIPLASQSSTGRVGESGTIAAELNRIIRLEEELKIIKSYMTNAKK
eukprot:CAMPEP_0202484516 /NCGR_PEP_ID=MMETSP1361-20130828/3593_1 /ASSEMBLY_ACC=CAM_ASM_000849 /TAXON_ID=210615 /ORGANISM="Staurosira complex sp., Strain CCMP2646" /LENGTH=291 /DNA_ID=CAMNT_0049113195 /DNA_START=67 /DNA_END=942 /DNA_ORIENTATION=+